MQLLANVEKLKIIKDYKRIHAGKNHTIHIEDKKIVVNSFHNFIIKKTNWVYFSLYLISSIKLYIGMVCDSVSDILSNLTSLSSLK